MDSRRSSRGFAPSCGDTPATRATRQLVRACRASLAATHDH